MPATPKRAGRAAPAGAKFPSEVVGENLKASRGERGYSQKHVAEAMGSLGHQNWSHVTVGEVERGKRHINVDELFALSAIYWKEPAELLRLPDAGTGSGASLFMGGGDPLPDTYVYLWQDGRISVELDEHDWGTPGRRVIRLQESARRLDAPPDRIPELPDRYLRIRLKDTSPADEEMPDEAAGVYDEMRERFEKFRRRLEELEADGVSVDMIPIDEMDEISLRRRSE